MATFAMWLKQFEQGEQNDPVAWLARQWAALEGNRPRVSSPTGIERHLTGDQVAPADEPQHGQFIGYVQQAVAEATKRYSDDRAREQLAGSNVSSSEQVASTGQQAIPGTPVPPAGAKPPAIINSKQWIEYPQADKFGSCPQEGWAYGVAEIDGKRVLTCAAGHVVNTGSADQIMEVAEYNLADPTSPSAGPGDEPVIDPAQVEDAASREQEWQSGVDVLGTINFKLDALLTVLGLPTSVDELAAIIAQPVTDDSIAAQLAQPGTYPPLAAQRAANVQPATFDQWWAAADFDGQPDG